MPSAKPSTRNDFIQQYINEKCSNYASDSQRALRAFLNKAECYAEKEGKPLIDFEKSDYIKMFSDNGWVGRRGNFDTSKSKLIKYLQYISESQLIVDESLNKSMYDLYSLTVNDLDVCLNWKLYFKTENDFLYYVENAGDERYTLSKMIVVLYWYGFSVNQILELKKSDIDMSNKSIAGVTFDDFAFNYIVALSNIDIIRFIDNANRLRSVELSSSNYLIRKSEIAIKKSEAINLETDDLEHLSSAQITFYVASFNKHISQETLKETKIFRAKSLAINRKFCLVREYEVANGIDFLDQPYTKSALMPCGEMDIKAHSDFSNKYAQWRKFFYDV